MAATLDTPGWLDEPASRNVSVLAHLAAYSALFLPFAGPFLIPLGIALLCADDEFARDNAIEALNFQLAIWIWLTIFGFLSFFIIGLPFVIAILIYGYIAPIQAAIHASKGKTYRYPGNIRLFS